MGVPAPGAGAVGEIDRPAELRAKSKGELRMTTNYEPPVVEVIEACELVEEVGRVECGFKGISYAD